MHSPRTHVQLAMTPCMRPLTMFKSKKELVQSVRDILGNKYTYTMYYVLIEPPGAVIDKAFKWGVLHRDCSIFNTMIEDLPNGSRRFLLDWEFTVEITVWGEYGVGGTVRLSRLFCRPS